MFLISWSKEASVSGSMPNERVSVKVKTKMSVEKKSDEINALEIQSRIIADLSSEKRLYVGNGRVHYKHMFFKSWEKSL